MNYYSGIDLGGTKIYSIIIDQSGNIIAREKVKTLADDTFDNIVNRIITCFEQAVKKANLTKEQVKAIGLAVPSAVDINKGILKHAPNLGIKNIKLVEIIFNKLKIPIFMDNDANLGVYGEYCFGSGKSFESVYGIFIGTGIGGGYVREGKIIRGINYTAGEIGHMVIKMNGPKCGCGQKGCFEAIAGKAGIVNYMKKLVDNKNKNTLMDIINPNWRKGVGSSDLKKCYIKRDYVVSKAIKRAGKAIGITSANLINVAGIDAIVFGGGLFNEFSDELLPIINKFMTKHSIADGAKGVNLLQSKLGDDAVSLGAAWFVAQNKESNLIYCGE